jgi:phosphoribosylglycinamide formyltransferase-1
MVDAPIPPLRPLRLGFLASHGGSGMRAIVAACDDGRVAATPCLLISNNAACAAMQWAAARGLATAHMSARTHGEALDGAIAARLDAAGVSLIVLSGYMRKLGPATVARYRGRILNIHPALLPRHGGEGMYGDRVHEAVLAAGDTISGATLHLVDDAYDTGPAFMQRTVPVLPDDTVETLGARVRAREQALLVEALDRIARGTINLELIAERDLRGVALTSARLVLAPFTAADADDVFDAVTPSLTRFLAFEPSPSRAAFAEVWRAWLPQMARGTNLYLVVRRAGSREFLGIAGLRDVGGPEPEVGIWIKEPAQRRGYGSEAVRAMLDWATRRREAESFLYPVAAENRPSRRIAERLGGSAIATQDNPKFTTTVLYRIPVDARRA